MLLENPFWGSPIVGSVIQVRVLVVDEDSTCLSLISGLLKVFNYQVATTQNPTDAIAMLGINENLFDLVLSNVYLPFMSGAELQKRIEGDFQIPVILMSAEEKAKIVEGLGLDENTCVLSKPPPISELRNLWQYVISSKKFKSTTTSNKSSGGSSSSQKRKPPSSSTEGNDEHEHDDDDDVNAKPSANKKAKLIWTTALHNRFLEAVRIIGYNRAVPKKIMECMNMPGLTRQNIASHLQKYRNFLRRVCDSSIKINEKTGLPENWNQKPFRSNFTWSQLPNIARDSFIRSDAARAFYETMYRQNQGALMQSSTLPHYNNLATTQLGNNANHVMSSSPFVDHQSSPYFGASSSSSSSQAGLASLLENRPVEPATGSGGYYPSLADGYRTEVDVAPLPLTPITILESSMIEDDEPKFDYVSEKSAIIGDQYYAQQASDQTKTRPHPMFATAPPTPGGFVFGSSSGNPTSDDGDMGRAINETIVAPRQGEADIKLRDNTLLDYYDKALESFISGGNRAAMPPIAAQPPHRPGNAVKAATPDFLESKPHLGNVFNIIMPDFVVQQSHHNQAANNYNAGNDLNAMSGFVDSKPYFDTADVNNMMYDYDHQFVTPLDDVVNLSINSDDVLMSNNVDTPAAVQPMIFGNQEDNIVVNSMDNGFQQGFDFQTGFVDQPFDWDTTYYEDYSMEPYLNDFADGLLSYNYSDDKKPDEQLP